jgi:cardiolipin synthase A/B
MNGPWREGNRVLLLENGEDFFPRVNALVRRATRCIYIETFILSEDVVGNALKDALVDAAARGIGVDLLLDGFGSDCLSHDFQAGLVAAGVRVHFFARGKRLMGFRTNPFRRMHRKITVIDDAVALVGGINFCAEQLLGSGPEALQDFAVEVEGPVVADIVRFVRMSNSTPAHTGVGRSPAAAADGQLPGTARARFVTRDNHRYRNAIELEYRRAIERSRREVLIANAYFFPGYRLLRALRRAARRGVQVTLLLQGRPDLRIVSILARWLHGYLLRGGVHIFEYTARPLHAKVAVIDDAWSTVGSSNLDPLSLSLNLEANLIIDDDAFHATLRSRLQCLISRHSRRLGPEDVPEQTVGQLLATLLVFHFLRHFPKWFGWLPAPCPRIQPLRPADTADVAPPPAQRSAAAPGKRSPWRWQGALGMALGVLVLYLLWRAADRVDWAAVAAAMDARAGLHLVLLGGAALVSHGLYGMLDALGKASVSAPLPRWRGWLTGSVCYGLGLNLGALVGGVAMRLRLYGRQGLDAGATLAITTASIAANWAGLAGLLALAPVWLDAEHAAEWGGGVGVWPAAALSVLLLTLYWRWSSQARVWQWRGHAVGIPRPPIALSQCLVATGNWALMAAILQGCLGGSASYIDALGVLLAAALGGVIVRIPGGWGVLEFMAVVMLADETAPAEVIAGVLVYRAVYYLVPLLFSLVGLGYLELRAPRAAPRTA